MSGIKKDLKLFQVNFSDSQEEEDEVNSTQIQNKVISSEIVTQYKIEESCRQHQIQISEQQQKSIPQIQQLIIQQNSQIHNDKPIDPHQQTPNFSSHLNQNRKLKRSSQFIDKIKSLSNSPFILHSTNNTKHFHKQQLIQQKAKRNTNQRKKIQKVNETSRIQDLQEINLYQNLKRSDTQTTDNSVKNIKQVSARENYQLIENEKTQSEKIDNVKQQVENIMPLFKHFKSFSFDTQASQDEYVQQLYEQPINQQECNNKSKQDDNNNDEQLVGKNINEKIGRLNNQINSVLSQYYLTKSYREKRNNYLKNSLYQGNQNTIKHLLASPIQQNEMIQFQVHVYKDLFKTQYQLWVKSNEDDNSESILLANAYNDGFHIDKTIFIINQVNMKNQKLFIAQLESNFTRDFYSLFGYCHYQEKSQKVNNEDINSYKITQLLNMSFTIDRTAYLPKTQKNKEILQTRTFQSQKNHQNLKEKYQKDKFTLQNTTFKMTPSKNINYDQQFYQKHKIRESKKTLLMQNYQNHDHLLFIGKIASKKYKILLGQGLSPLQAFGIIISHIETN